MDMKVFFLFENKNNQTQGVKSDYLNKIELDLSNETCSPLYNKIDYSLRDIMKLNVEELSTKIFVFDPSFKKENMKNAHEKGAANIDKIIKNLRCMAGINQEYIPKFKFI